MVPPSFLPSNYTATATMGSSSGESNKVLVFLREYKALECSCCSNIFGFQHRATGVLYCIGGCHEASPPTKTLPSTLTTSLPNQTATPQKFSENSVKNDVSSGVLPSVSSIVVPPPAPNDEGSQPVLTNGNHAPAAIKRMSPSVDTTDCGPPAPPAVVINPLKVVKDSIPKPEVKLASVKKETPVIPAPKPAVAAPKRSMWSQLEYSKKLTCANAQVHVNFAWSPISFSVAADDDEGVMNELQGAVKAYASKAQPMQTLPVVDDIVVSKYEGDFYRARVKKVVGETCDIEFIDFGDKKSCKYTELIPVNDALMKLPVFGMTVLLAKVPSPPEGFKMSEELEGALYSNSYIVDQVQKGISPSPGDADHYEVRLWDLQREGTVNEDLTKSISAALPANAINNASKVVKESSSKPEVKKETPVIPAPEPAVAAPRLSSWWSQLKYSKKLTCANAQVHVNFAWSPISYAVAADDDEGAMNELQDAVKAYALKAQPMQTLPVVDDIVVSKYEGDFYRARVKKVVGETCDIEFIDFGDKKSCKYTELIPVNDALMKYPVFGMTVNLAKVPAPPEGFKMSEELEGGWAPLTPAEQKEMAHLTSINFHFRETKELVEEIMKNEALEKNEKDMFVYRLDNADFTYTIHDLSLIKPSLVKDGVDVEIVKYEDLCSVVVKPVGDQFDTVRSDISERIQKWIKARGKEERKKLQQDFVPQTNELSLVRWPQWDKFYDLMEDGFGEDWYEDFYDEGLDIFQDDFERHSGKWFRASCRSMHHKINSKDKSVGVYEMFLVDLGKTTLIPPKEVYRMPHRFIVDYQMSLFSTVVLDDIIQYDDDVDEKWKYLLLPGIKIKVKVEWMYDEINIIRLIKPSEMDFNKHYLKPEVQQGIECQRKREQASQRARKVKYLTKENTESTYEENMKIVLAEEDEAAKRKMIVDEYSPIGHCHADLVLDLCLPTASLSSSLPEV